MVTASLVNGALSNITDVTDSILGHILFLLYINYINENVRSSISLFEDDSIIYRNMFANIDYQILHADLIKLQKFLDNWQI